MIYTVTLNPALDKTAIIPNFTLDQVNRITELRSDAGGKGINVSKVIKELGGTSICYALLGGNTGNGIEKALVDDGIEVRATDAGGETRTNLKTIDPVGDTHTDINEPGPIVNETILGGMLDKLVAEVKEGDTVVLAGSLPMGAADDTYATWISALKAVGAKCFLDADGEKLIAGLSACPYLTKPNEIELGGMLGRKLDTVEKTVEAARELHERGIDHVIVSMGGQGALYLTEDEVIKADAVKVKVGSTVGAGDSVVAALAYAEDEGMSLEEAAILSTAVGAANVMQTGTQAAPRSLVDSLVPKVVIHRL